MSRQRGIVTVSTNYEVKIKAPFDARQLCATKSDLTDPNSWFYVSTYVGMIVSVSSDPTPSNNGVYFLIKDEPTDESSWVKLFDENEFSEFQENLTQDLLNYVTQDQLSSYTKIHVGDLPETGEENTIYFTLFDGNWEERIWYNNQFVIIGSNSGDLSNYYTKAEVDQKLSELESKIPTSLSQLSNAETGYITSDVSNLTNYYTKSDTDSMLNSYATVDFVNSKISGVYKYRGSVPTYDSLPTSDMVVGDVYNVEDTGDNYAWDGTQWDKLAGTVDLSAYATKDEVNTLLSGKQDALVSGTNIKTINGQSILGSGNIEIQGGVGSIAPATEDTIGGILATDNSSDEGKEVFVDVDETGKASIKVPSISETSTAQDVVDLLNTDNSLILNGNA